MRPGIVIRPAAQRHAVSEARFLIGRQTHEGAGHFVARIVEQKNDIGFFRLQHALIVQRQPARRILRLHGMAGGATAVEDRLDVAIKFDVLRARLESQTCTVILIPSGTRLIVLLRGNKRRALVKSKTG